MMKKSKKKYKSVIVQRIWKSIRKISIVLLFLFLISSYGKIQGTNSLLSDTEVSSGNAVGAGVWLAMISNVGNTPPLDSQGESNDDAVEIGIYWETNVAATSNVIYDTTSQADCNGYSSASAPTDVTADNTDHEVMLNNLSTDTTYYYRVISEDDNGFEVCSDEYSFDLPASINDNPSDEIVLNEFLPNPEDDESDEWVELYNKDASDADVAGWYIYDSTDSGGVEITAANTDSGDTIVPAGGYLVVYLNKQYLNNSTDDEVKLFDDVFGVGNLIDSHEYDGPVPNDKSFARFPDGVGVWIDPDVTPGEKNELTDEELRYFREQAVFECFDNDGDLKRSKKDICQPEFLEYIGMLKDDDDKRINAKMLAKLVDLMEKEKEDKDKDVEEKEEDKKVKKSDESKKDESKKEEADEESDKDKKEKTVADEPKVVVREETVQEENLEEFKKEEWGEDKKDEVGEVSEEEEEINSKEEEMNEDSDSEEAKGEAGNKNKEDNEDNEDDEDEKVKKSGKSKKEEVDEEDKKEDSDDENDKTKDEDENKSLKQEDDE